jgi:hypothetical protein
MPGADTIREESAHCELVKASGQRTAPEKTPQSMAPAGHTAHPGSHPIAQNPMLIFAKYHLSRANLGETDTQVLDSWGGMVGFADKFRDYGRKG